MFKRLYLLIIIVVACNCSLIASKSFDTFSSIGEEPNTDSIFTNYKDTRLALVLSGGGSKALAHVGALEELEKLDIKPSLIIGVSSGSIVGSLYANGMSPSEIKNLLIDATAKDFLDYKITDLPINLSSNKKLKQFIYNQLGGKNFNDLEIPFVAVTTDLKTGDQVGLGAGDIATAVAASASYPGVFKPVEIEGKFYTDGGVSGNLPMVLTKKFNPKKILGVNIGYGIDNTLPTNAVNILLKSIQIMQKSHDDLSKQLSDYTIDIDLHDVSAFGEGHNEEMYKKGKNAVIENKQEILDSLSSDRH